MEFSNQSLLENKSNQAIKDKINYTNINNSNNSNNYVVKDNKNEIKMEANNPKIESSKRNRPPTAPPPPRPPPPPVPASIPTISAVAPKQLSTTNNKYQHHSLPDFRPLSPSSSFVNVPSIDGNNPDHKIDNKEIDDEMDLIEQEENETLERFAQAFLGIGFQNSIPNSLNDKDDITSNDGLELPTNNDQSVHKESNTQKTSRICYSSKFVSIFARIMLTLVTNNPEIKNLLHGNDLLSQNNLTQILNDKIINNTKNEIIQTVTAKLNANANNMNSRIFVPPKSNSNKNKSHNVRRNDVDNEIITEPIVEKDDKDPYYYFSDTPDEVEVQGGFDMSSFMGNMIHDVATDADTNDAGATGTTSNNDDFLNNVDGNHMSRIDDKNEKNNKKNNNISNRRYGFNEAQPLEDVLTTADNKMKQHMSKHTTSKLVEYRENLKYVKNLSFIEREKVMLLKSFNKYIETTLQLNRIHEICYHLWNNLYRFVLDNQNEHQPQLMKVCETLLNNVDTRSLSQKSSTLNNVKVDEYTNTSIESITNEVAQQISKLKHEFASQQANKDRQSITQIAQPVHQSILAMSSNVFCIVKYLLCEYLKSYQWMKLRHELFSSFSEEYLRNPKILDQKYLTSSIFGTYIMLCHLSNMSLYATHKNDLNVDVGNDNIDIGNNGTQIDEKLDDLKMKFDNNLQNKLEINENKKVIKNNEKFNSIEVVEKDKTNLLDWYFALIRVIAILKLNHKHNLNTKIINENTHIIKPFFDSLSKHIKQNEVDETLSELQNIIGDECWKLLLQKSKQLFDENDLQKDKTTNNDNNDDNTNWDKILHKIFCKLQAWTQNDLYFNFRKHEFCIHLIHLLSRANEVISHPKDSRSERLISLHKRFTLPHDQQLIESYSCALDRNFLYQGKMYIFTNYVCFYCGVLSMVKIPNKIVLPTHDIKKIEREVTAFIFHNAIKITMNDGRKYMFRSFMARDATFQLLESLIQKQTKSSSNNKNNHDKKKNNDNENLKSTNTSSLSPRHSNSIKNINSNLSNIFKQNKNQNTNHGQQTQIASKDVNPNINASSEKTNNIQKREEKENISNVEIKNIVKSSQQEAVLQLPLQPITINTNQNVCNENITSAPKQIEEQKENKEEKEVKEDKEGKLEKHEKDQKDDNEEKTEKHEKLQLSEVQHTKQQINDNIVLSSSNEDMNKFSSMDVILSPLPKYSKLEWEQTLNHDFDMSTAKFFETFIDDNCYYSTGDYAKKNSNNRNITFTPWQELQSINNDESYQKQRQLSLTTKIEDLPKFVPSNICEAKINRVEYLLKPYQNAYLLHRITQTKDIPFCDTYSIHEKIQFKQKVQIINDNDNNKTVIKLMTNVQADFACEWHRNIWGVKTQIKSKSLKGCKDDIHLWSKVIDEKIQQLQTVGPTKPTECSAIITSTNKQNYENNHEIDRDKKESEVDNGTMKNEEKNTEKISTDIITKPPIPLITPIPEQTTAIAQTTDNKNGKNNLKKNKYLLQIGDENSAFRCRFSFSANSKNNHDVIDNIQTSSPSSLSSASSSNTFLLILCVICICIIIFLLFSMNNMISMKHAINNQNEIIHNINKQYSSFTSNNCQLIQQTANSLVESLNENDNHGTVNNAVSSLNSLYQNLNC